MTKSSYYCTDALLKEISDWQAETFPRATEASILEHLRRETGELLTGIEGEYPIRAIEGELADVIFLAHAWLEKRGSSLDRIVARKFAVNKQRKWKQPDLLGVVEHEDA